MRRITFKQNKIKYIFITAKMVRKTRNCKYTRSRKHKRGGKSIHATNGQSRMSPSISHRSPPRSRRSPPEPDIFRVYFKINGAVTDHMRRQFSLQVRMGFQVRNPDPLRMIIFEHAPDPNSVIHDNTPNSVILSCDRRIPYYEECIGHVSQLIRQNNLPLHLRIHQGDELTQLYVHM
jgi:hypothetical protein